MMEEYGGIVVIVFMLVLAVVLYPYRRGYSKKHFPKQKGDKNKQKEELKDENA